MVTQVNARACSPDTSRRRFMAFTVLRFAVGFAIGALIALGEYCAWLPCYMSEWIVLSTFRGSLRASMAGPLLLQTLAAPLLSLAGLYAMAYPYTSRIIYTAFWTLHGIDVWNFLLLLSQKEFRPWLTVFPMALIVVSMGFIMLRIHTLATSGVTNQSSFSAHGTPPTAYLVYSIRLWGALLILQFVFDLLYLSVL